MKYTIFVWLIFTLSLSAQSFQSTDLPIVKIDTEGPIKDEPKVKGTLSIIFNGEGNRNHVTDFPSEYFGHCGVEIRGESTQSFPKQSFLVELWDEEGEDIDSSFLQFPSEEDFILYGPYSDKSLMNNVLAMHVANELEHYSSRTRYVELMVNQDYRGVYVLMEKIKRDPYRVDIAKLNPDDIDGDQLTGGYIIRIDKGEHAGWYSDYNKYMSNQKLYLQYYYPDGDDIIDVQRDYIQSYFDDFEEALASSTYYNNLGLHYTDYIDLRSFVDNFILNEWSKDVDAYRLSTYFHKDKESKGGKIHAGPFWDFNFAFGNGDYCEGFMIEGINLYRCAGGSSPFWWDRMLKDNIFLSAMRCRWDELRETILSDAYINQFIDHQIDLLAESQERNYERWPILGQYVWPNPPFYADAQSHQLIAQTMKDWINARAAWLDENLPHGPGDCDIFNVENFDLDHLVDTEPIISRQTILYPNPTKDRLYFSDMNGAKRIIITDITGRVVIDQTLDELQYITLNPLSSGAYVVTFKSEKGISVPQVIIKY